MSFRPFLALGALAILLSSLALSAVAPGTLATFGTPVTLGGGGEPGIQVDTSSSPPYYYVESADNIWRSHDHGGNWTRITPSQVVAGDANAAVGSTGNLYYQSLWVGSSWSWTSTNHGATWPVQTAFSTNAYADRNWIAAHGPSTVYAKADLFASGVQTPLIYKSTDAGATYAPVAGAVDGAVSDSGGFKGALTVDPVSGTLYLPSDQAVNVVTSVDGGDHLRVAHVPNPYGTSYNVILNVAVDAAGNAYLAWISQNGNQWTAQYSSSTDTGLTWSTPKILATGGGASRVFPWSAANAAGELVVAWYETTSSSASPDTVPGGTPWKVRVAFVSDAQTATPTTTFADATGTVHAGPICTSGVTCTGGTRGLLDFLGVAIDPTMGKALVVYTQDFGMSPTVKFVKQV
jgi:hypothetical protein